MTDRRGLDVTGTPEAVAAYDRALDHLLRFQVELVENGALAVAADPNFTMGHVLNAYVTLLSTDGAAQAEARAAVIGAEAAAEEVEPLPRERAHLDAARRWIDGDMLGAGAALDAITIEYPRDILALAVGHQVDFFTGRAPNLRDRIGRALRAWGPDDPDHGFLLGTLAFGLEECNLYGQSEEIGRGAVDTHPEDVWAIHAVVHTYEMQGRVAEGSRYMQERESDWAVDNFLNVHNSWHYALYSLQGDDLDRALDVYDRVLHHEGSDDVALELLDATGLLWRIDLDGGSVGDRWQSLAEAWARSLSPGLYPFNDMHAAMAYVGAGDLAAARDLVRELERVAADPAPTDTGAGMTASVGLPVCRALLAFGEEHHAAVLAELMDVRDRLHTFGGSHAQRDAMERTLVESAIRCGRFDLADALVSERLAVREASTWSWAARARAHAAAGDPTGASIAERRAQALAAEIRVVLA